MNGGGATMARELVRERARYLAFVRGRVRSAADADDVFQLALARAARHADELREPAQRQAWFFRILRRALADHHAATARHARLATEAANEPAPTITEEPPAVCGCTVRQLAVIRPDYAEMLRRVDLDEEPIAEVAASLGITPNNATVRLHRARAALRRQLESFCGTTAIHACRSCSCDS